MISQKNVPQKRGGVSVSPLEEIELSKKEVKDILIGATAGALIGELPIARALLTWVDRVNQAENEIKTEKLLKRYAENFQDIHRALRELQILIKTPGGQTLFRKIIQITNNSVGDDEWVDLLAKTLKSLSDQNLEQYFELTSYAISQIDRLSPQSLILLSKFDYWKSYHIQSTTTTSGQTLSGDWDQQAAGHFARHTGITSPGSILRIKHTFKELENAGMIILTGHAISPTAMGHDVYNLIKGNGIPKK